LPFLILFLVAKNYWWNRMALERTTQAAK
jgi:hypothetical protein